MKDKYGKYTLTDRLLMIVIGITALVTTGCVVVIIKNIKHD